MHSHVIGIVPTFKFAIDTFAEEQFQVSEIFASENFDMGEPEHTDENSIFSKGTCVTSILFAICQGCSPNSVSVFSLSLSAVFM